MKASFKYPLSQVNIYMDGILARVSAHAVPENKMGKHYHANTNTVFILEGGCVEKREHSTFERVITDIILLHARETHETIMAECPTKYLSLDIEAGILARYDISEHLLLAAIEKSPDAKFLMLKICREILCNDASSARFPDD
jgi:AraC family transcriptional regulator